MTLDRDATSALTDAAIKAMFDQRARRADALDLRGPILAATLGERQRRRWRIVLPKLVPPRLARGLVLALIGAAILGLVTIGSGAFQADPAIKGSAPGFVRPFDYAIPAGADFRPSLPPARAILAWAAGPIRAPQPGEADPNGGQRPRPSEARGIVIGSGAQAWSHSPDGRYTLRTRPADFLTDLRDTGKVPMSAVTETTIDGRPALTATHPGMDANDIHVAPGGLSGDFVLLSVPSRLIVADIDGTTIFVVIWARTAEDLAAWMPVAEEFVASIRFR